MNRPEQEMQIGIVSHLRARLAPPWMVFHVRNQGEQSSMRMHGLFKAMGVVAGMPDLFVLGPPRLIASAPCCTLIAIECKAPPKMLKSGAKSKAKPAISPEQFRVIAQLGQNGVPTIVARSWDDAERALRGLGVPLTGKTV